MSFITTTANMSLTIPVVGQELGPNWASDINNCLTLIDTHDHTTGKGMLITPAAMNISTDLPLNSHNMTLVRTVRMDSQGAALALATDLNCLYVVSGNLYFNDGSGIAIAITSGHAVAGTPGSIGNLASPASATYVAASTKFVFQSDTSVAADLDGGSVILRLKTASAYGLTLAPPAGMSANYSITLPALPSSVSKLVSIDTSGNLAATQDLIPAGAMFDYAGATAPSGYLMCDGAAVSRTTYSALFTAIGTTYGVGDNSTTFNLPDFRGRFARYMDNMGTAQGAANRDAGRTLGSSQVDATDVNGLSVPSSGSHTHTATDLGHVHPIQGYPNRGLGGSGATISGYPGETTTSSQNGYANISVSYTAHSHTMSSTDSETRPINLSCNKIIKY